MTEVLKPSTITTGVSVVVCAYTEARFDQLVAAVASVEAQSVPASELIVVIDHCPGLFARARAAFCDARVVENTDRAGLSGARNTAVGLASGEIVAFLDDDAAAAPDWIERLVEQYASPSVAGVGGLVEPAWSAGRPGWFPPEFDWVVGCSHAGMPHAVERVRNFVGANMSFRRSVLVELGGFTAELGRVGADAAGCEETELCIRAQRGGTHSLIYAPAALVRHTVPKDRGTFAYFRRRCLAEGRSKALVSDRVGASSGLGAERTYVARTLPRALARCAGGLARREPCAGRRALALVSGTALTTLAYLARRIAMRLRAVPRGPVLGLSLSATLIAIALSRPVALGHMGGLGLLDVLPGSYFAGLVVLIVSFALTVSRHPRAKALLVAHTALLLVSVHGMPALLYPTLRYAWAWKHVAISDGIIAAHGVNLGQAPASLVAYQDWGGFFSLAGVLTNASGIGTALRWAAIGPLVNEALFGGPLWLIFRHFSADRRVAWGALWIFYLGNWIAQDYFSPQGFAFFLYLVVIALVLRYCSKPGHRGAPAPGWAEPGVAERRGAYVTVCVLIVAIVVSHQLTPYMLVSSLACLLVVRRLRHRSLVLVAALTTIGWTIGAGWNFLKTNPSVYASIGNLLSNASVQALNTANASADQLLISKIDRLTVAAIAALALVGLVRNACSRRRTDLLAICALLASAAVALVGNSYGGEIMFRVYLFALPFLALLGALAFARRGEATEGRRRLGIRLAVLVLLLGGFLFSYLGSEKLYYLPPREVRAIEPFFSAAPAGSLLVGFADNSPFPLKGYSRFTYFFVTEASARDIAQFNKAPLSTLERDLASQRPSYLLFTSSQRALVSMTGDLPTGEYERVERRVAHSPAFRTVVHAGGVHIFTLAGEQPPASSSSATGAR